MNKLLILLLLVGCIIGGAVIGVAAQNYMLGINNTVTVKTPAALTAEPASIGWGRLTQGTSINYTVAITNNGETESGTLNFTTPDIPAGLTLAANSTASILPAQTATIQFTLSASEDTVPAYYSFYIQVLPLE